MLRFKILPSGCVESYFAHQCQRNLLYKGVKDHNETRERLGLNRPFAGGDDTAIKAGQAWELKIAQHLRDQGVLVAGESLDEYFSCAETVDKLRETAGLVDADGITRYLYQGTLKATEEYCRNDLYFDESLWRGESPYLHVVMGEPRTDFLKIWKDGDLVRISVIDAKLSKRMKLEHKVQVAMYVRMLSALIREEKLPLATDEEYGYLWNSGQESPGAFSLPEINDILDDYLRGILARTIEQLCDAVKEGRESSLHLEMDVCVGGGCEYCENYEQCNRLLKKSHSIQLLPYLSGFAQRYLMRMDMPRTIEEFMLLADTDSDVRQALKGNRSWERILSDASILEVARDAMPYDREAVYNAASMWKKSYSFSMPRWQDIALILTAQKDTGTDYVYALGYRVQYLYEERRGEHFEKIFLERRRDRSSWLENALDFVKSLYELLSGISGSSHSLQAYVMDSYELDNLQELLYILLSDDDPEEEYRHMVMTLVLWLQGERVVTDSFRQPTAALAWPVVTLSAQLQSLLALPIPISYTLLPLRSALHIGVKDEFKMSADSGDYDFFGLISDAIPSKMINLYWDGKDDGIYERYRAHLIKRFVLENAIRTRLQSGWLTGEENNVMDRHLLARLDPFTLPKWSEMKNPLLSRWAFMVKYENLLQCHMIRAARQEDTEHALMEGSMLELEYEGYREEINGAGFKDLYFTFRVVNSESVCNEGWFWGLLRCDTQQAVRDQIAFDDYRYSSLRDYIPYDTLGMLNFIDYQYRDEGLFINGIAGGGNKTLFKNIMRSAGGGDRFFLSERYLDLNSAKLMELLGRLDGEKNPDFLEPEELLKTLLGDYDGCRDELLSFGSMDGYDFTPSQEAAFKHLFERRLTVLQGPPGSGKTDFIARAVIILCRFFREKRNVSLRILISANSHAAIENALRGVRDKLKGAEDICLIKADRMESGDRAGIEVADKRRLAGRISEEGRPVVAGATNWACSALWSSAYNDMPEVTFDLVIIDEASQVRVMDALLALDRVKDKTGRYLLVGDDDQLPPIIQGRYEKKEGEPYVYGSVFRYYRDMCMAQGCGESILMLEECFRMNEILLRYSAEKIYGSAYHAFRANAARHLEYPEGAGGDIKEEWLRYALDDFRYEEGDYWPLVFFHIAGADPYCQKCLERRLVSELTDALKKTLGKGCDEHGFWRGGQGSDGILGIISPHHEHIEKLKADIVQKTGMSRDELFIGTVDKLQGQQRDVVIVSYGVTDLESAAGEREFLFNRNRLNVSLTRGKSKTLVLFSEILAKCPPELLGTDDEDIQRGVDYVCGLMSFMERTSDDTEISSREFIMEEGGKELTLRILRKRIRGNS